MGSFLRQTLLVVGLVMLFVGWGLTRYADAQQVAVASGKSEPLTMWIGEKEKVKSWIDGGQFVPGRTLYLSGIIGMGLGGALVAVTFRRTGGRSRIGAGP